jgi:CDP-diacylglycerol--glycerol-3-phosphate 3-phosphatidyltransferase
MPELIERDTLNNANKRPQTTRFKYAANLISGLRLVLAIPLFFSANIPWLFCLLYLACGLSDALDGFVARRTHTQSELGAKLDSIGDLVFTAVILAVLLGWLGDRLLDLIPWLIIITVVRGLNLVIAAAKFRTFAIIHTWANKATGLALFVSPVIYVVWPQVAIFYVVSGFALLSAVEETLILLTTHEIDLDRRTLFHF